MLGGLFKKKPKISSDVNSGRITPLVENTLVEQITPALAMSYGTGPITASSMYPMSGKYGVRSRAQIYHRWSLMANDPIAGSAIGLLVTAALGGHETTGKVLFIEKTPEAQKDKKLGKMVDEIADDLGDLLNEAAYPIACTMAAFGDAYTRMYFENGKGLTSLYFDELVRPPLVQSYERGGQTIGFSVSTGEKNFARLDTMQLARFKMQRLHYVPQHGINEKSLKWDISEDDLDAIPIMPASVGGSLSYQAEGAYERLVASLAGMTSQRIIDSIQESVFNLNMENMTKEDQERFEGNFIKMMLKSQQIAKTLVDTGEFHSGRVVHAIPVWGEKQMVMQGQPLSSPRMAAANIDDVMLNAKLFSGAYGVDLSMLGFSDLLSGGLGDGGFINVSAQTAQRCRPIRTALLASIDHIINVHCLYKYGVAFNKAQQPWQVNVYATIAALETQRQETLSNATASGMSLVQTMQALKDMGSKADTASLFLSKTMLVDEELATEYGKLMEATPPMDPNMASPPEEEPIEGGNNPEEEPAEEEEAA